MKKLFFVFFTLAVLQLCSAQGIINYQKDVPFSDSLITIEKVYLQIDREGYFPGDDIWFKAYLVDASTQLLTNHSGNLHVEIISPGLEIVESRTVKLNGGLANGDFHLSENFKSGKYCLRAYTNYMRNFGDELFFKKDIIVINSKDAGKAFPVNMEQSGNRPDLMFFPEGGALVNNVLSTVAFKAVDNQGIGCNIKGKVFSSAGEIVTHFESTHNGMGTFLFTPSSGEKYYAIINSGGDDIFSYDIPESFSSGVVMSVINNNSKELNLLFKTNPETFPIVRKNDLSVTVSIRNIPFKTYSFRMKSMNSYFRMPVADLPEGIVMLTLSDVNNKPLCERLVFINKEVKPGLIIRTNKEIYNKRDSVLITISLSDSSLVDPETYLSLSATDTIFTKKSSGFPSTIASWFLLESDLRGKVEDPSYYFDLSNPNRYIDLDMLLLTQGWRDFQWKYETNYYPPENGFTVSGRVRKKFTNVPVKKADVTIGIFQYGKPSINMVPTDSAGRFYLNGIDLTGNAKLIASVTSEKDDLKGWLLLDSMKYHPAEIKNRMIKTGFSQNNFNAIDSSSLVKTELHKYIQYSEFKNSMQKRYKLSDTISPGEVSIVARRIDAPESARARSVLYLMGQPDKEMVITPQIQKMYFKVDQFLISNMVLLPRGSSLPKGSGSLHWMQNPVFMIDGMKVTKSDVEALPVRMVERIDILNQAASYQVFGYGMSVSDTGSVTFGKPDGVISIILKSDWINEKSTVYHSANIKFTGYDEPRIFYSPKHHSMLEYDYKPDLRTTLFWEPDIIIESHKEQVIKYFNSDNTSVINIIVEGITSTGIPVYGMTKYEVQ